MIKYTLTLLTLLFLTGCSTTLKMPSKEKSLNAKPLHAYARVLKKYVNAKGQVDFEGLQKDREDLDSYIAYVSQFDAYTIKDRDRQLAHYINSYNALSMWQVLEKGIPETNSGLKKIKFFFLTKITVGGRKTSLYKYEKDLIRTQGDERIHFALNCMAVSCPTLPKVPFSGRGLKRELEREALAFFNDPKHCYLDKKEETVYISDILNLFTEDFVPSKALDLISYVNRYRKEKIPSHYDVEFIDYDWRINNSNRIK